MVSLALIGAFMIIFGVVQLSATDVKCGSRAMSPGDECTTYSRRTHRPTTRSYDEQRTNNTWVGYGLVIVGGVMLLASGGYLIAGLRRRPAPAPPGYPPRPYPQQPYPPQPYPQGYPAQPGYPPQPYPPQGYPAPTGYPPQGYPVQQGYPPPGYPQPPYPRR